MLRFTLAAIIGFAILLPASAAAAPPFFWWTAPQAQQALAKKGIRVERCGGSQPSIPLLRAGQPRPTVVIRYRTFQCVVDHRGGGYVYIRTSKTRRGGFCKSFNQITNDAKAELLTACP